MKNLARRYWKTLSVGTVFALMFGLRLTAATAAPAAVGARHDLSEEVRHELIMLPYYSVFDNLAYAVQDNDTVVLSGEVVRSSLKQDAENVVRRVAGVQEVINQIKVLPTSPVDDRIRRAEFFAIYSTSGFEKYAMQAVPPIHIIVDNGNVTLEGVVGSVMDRTLAGVRANEVPGVFSVTNNLRVD